MANICDACGKKIGILDGRFELSDGGILCYKCSELIQNSLIKIETNKENFEQLELIRNKVIDYCESCFDEKVTSRVIETIDLKCGFGSSKGYEERKLTHEEQKYADEQRRLKNEQYRREAELSKINHMVTTGYNFEGFRIVKYLEVISGEVVLGTGFLSEFSASLADFLGTGSEMFANKLDLAKKIAKDKLVSKSAMLGGNAIIGVDFDYITFSNNMIGVIANGTSVNVEKIEE